MYVIRYAGMAGTVIEKSHANPGEYLKDYKPEAHGGQGYAEFTGDIHDAIVFEDMAEAYRLIFTVPVRKPKRADGKANMPLRAFHLVVEKL